MDTSPSKEVKAPQGHGTADRFHAFGFQMSSFSAAGSRRFWMSNSRCVVRFGRNIWQAACQHRIAITTNVKPRRPDRAARNLGSSITGSCHSTGCKPMTALLASVCMMYNPMSEPDPKMLWKMPVCETVTRRGDALRDASTASR